MPLGPRLKGFVSTGNDRAPSARWVAAACLPVLSLAWSEPPDPPACPPGGPTPETCNGIDDDCDGETDEGLELLPEICNGLDDNCDGRIDENVFGVVTGPLRWNARASNTPGNGVIASSGQEALVAWYLYASDPVDSCPEWNEPCPHAAIVTAGLSEALEPAPLMPAGDGPYSVAGYVPAAAAWADDAFAIVSEPLVAPFNPSLQIVGSEGPQPPVSLAGQWSAWGAHKAVAAVGWTGESIAGVHWVGSSPSGYDTLLTFHSVNGEWIEGGVALWEKCLHSAAGWQGDRTGFWMACPCARPAAVFPCWPRSGEEPVPCPFEMTVVRVHGSVGVETWTLPQTDFPAWRYPPVSHNPVKDGDELVLQVIEEVRTSPPGMYEYWTVRADVSGSAPRVLSVERQPWAALRVRGAGSSLAHSRGVSDHPNPSHLDYWHLASTGMNIPEQPTGSLAPSRGEPSRFFLSPGWSMAPQAVPLDDGTFVLFAVECPSEPTHTSVPCDILVWQLGCLGPPVPPG